MKNRIFLLALIIFSLFSKDVFSAGEVFRVKLTGGKEYCESSNAAISVKGYVDYWIRIDSETQITVSRSQDMSDNPIVLTGSSLVFGRKQNNVAISGSTYLDDGSYVSISATGLIDKNNLLKSLRGTLIYNWASLDVQPDLDSTCFGNVTFSTSPRIALP